MTESVPRATVNRYRLVLVFAAVLWSLSGLFVKSPLLRDIPLDVRGPLLACYRVLFAGLLLLPFVRRRHIRWRPGLIPLVVAFSVMNVLYVTALTRTTAAAAIFLQYTATGWIALISVFVLREKLQRTTLIPLAGAACGIAWIVIAETHPQHASGNMIAMTSGFSLGCTIIMLRILNAEDSAWLTALTHLAGGLVLLPWVCTFDVQLTAIQWGSIALLGIVQMGLPYMLFSRSLRYVSATEAVLITLLEPILNPILTWLAWGEPVGGDIWIGGSLILGSLAAKYLIDLRRPAVDNAT